MVRCSRCGVEWTAEREPDPPSEAESDPTEADPPPAPVIDAADRPVPPAGPPRRPALIAAWIASVLALVGAATASVAFRAEITALWPPSERVLGSVAAVPTADGAKRPHVAAESAR
jgi:hypothetical protein